MTLAEERLHVAAVRRTEAPPSAGSVSHAVWLSDGVLLLVGAVDQRSATKAGLVLERSDGAASRVLLLPFPGTVERRSDAVAMLVLFDEPVARGGPLGRLTPRASRGRLALVAPADLSQVTCDLKTLVREALAWLDPETRAAILRFLVRSTADRAAEDVELARSLHRVREALRERHPRSAVGATIAHILQVEAISALDGSSFYIEGWLRCDDPARRLVAVSPEGARIELGAQQLFSYPRSDVAAFLGLPNDPRTVRPGFVCFFETPVPTREREGWIFELHADGVAIEFPAPRVEIDPVAARTRILRDLKHEALPAEDLRRRLILPAIGRIQAGLASVTAAMDVDQYGSPPDDPDVSIVVPLYRRLDFLEHQLAQFCHDPELRRSDLIYVLDSPDDAAALKDLATALHRLYDVPFRVVVLNRNSGFSTANNIGASFARGRLLVLLNSDVLPDAPGWLSGLADFHDRTPDVGAVSPKLLYEDGSIQHAGLYFERAPGAHVWSNEHFFKGLAGRFPAANVARPVPAVTAACLMISLDLYREHGGLRGTYVQGDYEDSDLCLRLREAGLGCWYVPQVQLYHLEGQSYPSELRRVTSGFNAWVQTAYWDERIQSLMAAPALESRTS